MQTLGQPTEYWDTILIYLICRRLDQSLRQECFVQTEKMQGDNLVIPKLSQLFSFLEIQCNAMESAKAEETMFKSKPDASLNSSKYSKITGTVSSKAECIICHHQYTDGLYKCSKFKNISLHIGLEAIKSSKICFNYLKGSHSVSGCTYKSYSIKCGPNHNILKHYQKKGLPVSQ